MFFPPWCGTLEIKHTCLRKVCEALCGTAPGCAEVGLVAALAPGGGMKWCTLGLGVCVNGSVLLHGWEVVPPV